MSIKHFTAKKSVEIAKWLSKKDVKFEFIGVLRHMRRYFSYTCDDTDVQADWGRSCTYGRSPNAIDMS